MGIKVLLNNKKTYFNYNIIETFTAGIVLEGTEIKSVRKKEMNLLDSFCFFKESEMYIKSFYIKEYSHSSEYFNHDPYRPKKLLLRKVEIMRLIGKMKTKGYSIAPLKVILDGNLAKMEIALVQGKKLHDKRKDIKSREAKIEMGRAMKRSAQ